MFDLPTTDRILTSVANLSLFTEIANLSSFFLIKI